MQSDIKFVSDTDAEIDPGFNAGFFERLIAFIRELLAGFLGLFRKAG